MKLIDGQKIAGKKLVALQDSISKDGALPACAIILIGTDPASQLYVKLKERAAKETGIELRRYLFGADVEKERVLTCIHFLNNDSDTHGIIVQLPLPKHLNPDDIVSLIDPQKDVDGFHPVNQKKFISGQVIKISWEKKKTRYWEI